MKSTIGNNDELKGMIALNGKEVPIGTGFMKNDSQLSEAEFDIAMQRGNVPKDVAEKMKKAYFSNAKSEQNENNSSNKPISPTTGKDGKVFVWATQPSYLNGDAHFGLDGGAPGGENSPSYSVTDGNVSDIRDSGKKDGRDVNSVTVKDKDGNYVTSKHITPDSNLKIGDPVDAGTVLGTHDLSGKAAGKNSDPHTHLEVRNSNNERMDAFQYLFRKQPNLEWDIHPNLQTKFNERYPVESDIIKKKRGKK